MNKAQYKNYFNDTSPAVLDMLREVVEWVNRTLKNTGTKDFEFMESVLTDETGFSSSQGVEQMGGVEYSGAKKTANLVKGEWGILVNIGNGVIKLNYDAFKVFRSALVEVLKKQPIGFVKHIQSSTDKISASVILKNEKVYIVFGKKPPIYICEAGRKQGRFLLFLSNPKFGLARSIKDVAEEMEIKQVGNYLMINKNKKVIKNAVREIQRKLAKKEKRGALHCFFDDRNVWLKIT
jgi:hypothetical protein